MYDLKLYFTQGDNFTEVDVTSYITQSNHLRDNNLIRCDVHTDERARLNCVYSKNCISIRILLYFSIINMYELIRSSPSIFIPLKRQRGL